jgi:hypothetical protein
MKWLTGLCTLFLLAFAPAAAQFDTATVIGVVKDGSGAVVSGATVTLTHTATGVSGTRTRGSGHR